MTTRKQKVDQAIKEKAAQAAVISDELMIKRRRAAGDVTRQRVMGLLHDEQSWTAREMADSLDVGVNGLYYHLRVLEEAELIQPARPKSGSTERAYEKGEKWLVTHELNEDLILAFNAILETGKYECADAVRQQIRAVAEDLPEPFVTVNAPRFATTSSEIREFAERLSALVTEFWERGQALAVLPVDEDTPLHECLFTYALIERTARPSADAAGQG